MRIAIDIKALCYDRGGTSVYLRNLLQHLVKVDQVNNYFPVAPPGISLDTYMNKVGLIKRTVYRLGELTWLHWGLSGYLTTQKMDLYHSTSMVVFQQLGCPMITTIMDVTPILFPETHDWKWVWYFKQILKHNCANASMIIVPSENTRNDLFQLLKPPRPPMTTIPLGVDDGFFQPGDHVLEKINLVKQKYGIKSAYIYSVCTLEPRKNLEMLVDNFLEINQRELKDYSLVITGAKGWKYESVLAKIKKFPDKIIYTGKINDEDLKLLYRGATLFVYPSVYEGFGLTPLEAMASGCPVVASESSSMKDVLGNSVKLVSPRDPDQLKDAIIQMLEDKLLQEKYIKKGLLCASKYKWEYTARATLEVYEKLAGRSKLGS